MRQMTMRKTVLAAAIFLTAVWGTVAAAQQSSSDDPTLKLDAKLQAEIIDSVTSALNNGYVFKDVAQKMEDYIRKQYKKGAYKEITDRRVFGERLTADLLEISHDKHLGVRYASPELVARFAGEDSLPTPEQQKAQFEESAYENFGFVKAERLTGNIGYIKFDRFEDARYAGPTAIAALNYLAYCDGLIIDLRDNGGGEAGMIRLISSYFFDESKHLTSWYWRATDSIEQSWSPDYVVGPRMADVDLYILTSSYTFSAAEEFTYNLKNLERATIVGETTGGGAHPVTRRLLAGLNMGISIPNGRAINPISGTNWEGTGIEPHIAVPRDQALDAAYREAVRKLAAKITDERKKNALDWTLQTLDSKANPVTVAPDILQRYAGSYGPRKVLLENGELYYQREGRPKFKMIAMANDLFRFDDLEYFRIKFVIDAQGNPTELIGMYDTGTTDSNPRDK